MSELIVHHLPGAWGLPSVSPFCLKLETWLRMMGIPSRTVIDATPFGAPKKKLPYIEHRGNSIGDSSFIIDYLEREFGVDGNAGLTDQQKAMAHAVQRMLEENLYWTMVYDRWMVDANWQFFRDIVLAGIPLPIRRLAAPAIRRGVGKSLRGQGLGVHSLQEIHAIGIKDLGAMAQLLGDRPFLMGETPTTIDAAAYGLLANMLMVPVASPVKDEGLARPNLVAYLERIRDNYFSEE